MSLLTKRAPRYEGRMKQAQPISLMRTASIALALTAFAAASGLAFASWLDKSEGIFLSLVEAGMSWCF